MRNKKFSLTGVLVILLLAVAVVFLFYAFYIFNDLQKVRQDVVNLYNEFKVASGKIDKFGLSEENSAEKSMKFTEATKNWQIYQNDDYHFQLKNPASFGDLTVVQNDRQNKQLGIVGQSLTAKFSKMYDSALAAHVVTYNYANPQGAVWLADKSVFDELNKSASGECASSLFDALKTLSAGEIRNCFVYENILSQKYVIYRLVNNEKKINTLEAVFPRETFYVAFDLAGSLDSQMDYLLQSVVFLK